MKQHSVNAVFQPSAERLRNLRLDRRLTSIAVAEGAGISRPHLSMLENGVTPLKIDTARKLATFFGVDAEWLMTGKASPLQEAESQWMQAIKASGLDEAAEKAIDEITAWLRQLVTGPESIRKLARAKIQSIAEGFAEQCAKRNAPIRQASLEMARARFSATDNKVILDIIKGSDISASEMEELWPEKREAIKAALSRGSQIALAKYLKVTPQAVSQYLTGTSAPSIEIYLQMEKWVSLYLKNKNEGPGAVRATPEPKTRTKKTRKDELSSDP